LFIPIRDDEPTVRKPIVTIGLMVINIFVFLATYLQGPDFFNAFTIKFGFIPTEFTNSVELTPYNSISPYFTAVSSMFMHGGLIHLLGNMLFMWIFANNVEDYLGHIPFLLFYIVAGLAALALYTLFLPDSQMPLVGASGAIAGAMGAYLVIHPRARITVLIFFFFITFVTIPAKVVLGIWFAIQLFMSLGSSYSGGGVAWMAHVGGFAFGWVVLKLIVMITGRHGPTSGRQRVYRMDWS
jgi:membrane associated rhomboid family serine protease